jgi:hypothetical protein
LGFPVVLLFLVLPVVWGGVAADGELSLCLDRSFKAEGAEFFGPCQEVVVGPGGRIYVACIREHSIYPVIKKKLERSSFEEFFGDHLAYYSGILTNPEGHIVLLRGKDLITGNEAGALIISDNGAVQRDFKIKTEGFQWWENRKFKNFSFYTREIAMRWKKAQTRMRNCMS